METDQLENPGQERQFDSELIFTVISRELILTVILLCMFFFALSVVNG